MPTDPTIQLRLSATSANGSTPDRRPGRPYFEPEGAAHLVRTLAGERSNERIRVAHVADGDWPSFGNVGRSTVLDRGEQVMTLIDQLRRKIADATALHGPSLGASILGYPDDTLERILELVESIDADRRGATLSDVEQTNEVRRLEDELGKAQRAYDYERGMRVAAEPVAHELLTLRYYADELAETVAHLAERWSKGTTSRVIARAFKRAQEHADHTRDETSGAGV